MLAALAKAFRQLSDPAFRRVLILSVAGALAVFAGLWVLAWLGLSWLGDALADWVAAQAPDSFWPRVFEWVFGAAAVVAVLIASFFLFPAVMVVAMSFLLDAIATAVERRHYPELPAPREPPVIEEAGTALLFLAATLALNIVALPLYLVLLFVPPLNLFVFYLLNGYLLGREYYELVAMRRLAPGAARRFRRAHRGRLLLAGVLIALLLTIPLVNLVMPIVATGFMLHVFEDMRRRELPTG